MPDNVRYLSKLANDLEAGGQNARAVEILQRLLAVATQEEDRERIEAHIGRLEAADEDG